MKSLVATSDKVSYIEIQQFELLHFMSIVFANIYFQFFALPRSMFVGGWCKHLTFQHDRNIR